MRYAICLGSDYTPTASVSPTYNFERSGFEYRYFVYNIADTITMLAIASMIVPVVSSVKLLLPKSKIFMNAD
jgi:hypothetical protein